MKRVAVAMHRLAGAVGLEGALLGIGTAFVAVAASYWSPAGPWLVVGAVSMLAGVALALPTRSGDGPHR